MNDTYVEQLIAKKPNPLSGVLKVVVYGIGIVCAIMGLLGWFSLFLLAIALFLVAYFALPMLDVEYEYLYLSKEISIDKIIAKQRRKHALSIDLNKVSIIAPENSHELDSYKNRPHEDKDFTAQDEGVKAYIVAYEDGENLSLVKMDLNEEMLKAIKMVFPRKVVEY